MSLSHIYFDPFPRFITRVGVLFKGTPYFL
nr:MAG TPA: hypothetical protein [Caudoviricetes sp.]